MQARTHVFLLGQRSQYIINKVKYKKEGILRNEEIPSLSVRNLMLALAGHVEAEANAVVVLRKVADSAQRSVAADGRNGLKHVQKLLRLKQNTHAASGLLGIGGQREEQGLQRELALVGVVSVGAADGLAVNFASKLSVLSELQHGVR